MPMRSVLGCLLVVLAALSVPEIALEGTVFRGRGHAEWHAPSQHQTLARPSPRAVARTSQRCPGVIAAMPSAPLIATPAVLTTAPGPPGFASPMLAAVFVPPRV